MLKNVVWENVLYVFIWCVIIQVVAAVSTNTDTPVQISGSVASRFLGSILGLWGLSWLIMRVIVLLRRSALSDYRYRIWGFTALVIGYVAYVGETVK